MKGQDGFNQNTMAELSMMYVDLDKNSQECPFNMESKPQKAKIDYIHNLEMVALRSSFNDVRRSKTIERS